MKDDLIRARIHQAVDRHAEPLETDPFLARRIIETERKGKTIVKKKMPAILVLAIILTLFAAAALAVTLLTHQEVVEQVAVPLAVDNDDTVGVKDTYGPEQLAELVRALNENGITLEENDRIMQALQNGRGYYEEETIMEICRRAFGGNYYTWTLEQQDWFEGLMVQIGFHETHLTCLPGENNMTYEEAEAFAFKIIRGSYGQGLPLEDRDLWALSRQFYLEDPADPGSANWSFSLEPKDLDHGMYTVGFSDADPEGTYFVSANIHDWSQPYTGDELFSAFHEVYSWNHAAWPQEAWRKLHAMLQDAWIDPGRNDAQPLTAFRLTDYPEPGGKDISGETAVEKARETMTDSRAALDGAVLTEYEGKRCWMVSFRIDTDAKTGDTGAGLYVIGVDSACGTILGTRKQSLDDTAAFAFTPEAAYEKAWEGFLRRSEVIDLAATAIEEKYPGLDLRDEDKFGVLAEGVRRWNVTFRSKDLNTGNASAAVATDGTVSNITADTAPLDGDNLWDRYRQAYGYFGQWDQAVWVKLGKDMAGLEPASLAGRLLKATRYPEESSAVIGRDRAMELGMRATGKRTAEVNTCVLVDAGPHPVWIMRILTDEADEPVIGIDSMTGETAFTEKFKVDYTPQYVLCSLPEVWRKAELETLGAAYMAKVAVTHAFGDMWLDEPELDVDDTDNWETLQDGLLVRFIGRWKGMKSYEVELDENGFVLRCEETETPSDEEKPVIVPEGIDEDGAPEPLPTPQPDGRPWIWGNAFAPDTFWESLARAMEADGVSNGNIREKTEEWTQLYGPMDQGGWPQEKFVIGHVLTVMTPGDLAMDPVTYPVLPSPEKPPRGKIELIAAEAFHGAADAQMGKEWVDALKAVPILWNDAMDPAAGTWTGKTTWLVDMRTWEYEYRCWNSKGYVLLDEDGNVLSVQLELDGNG